MKVNFLDLKKQYQSIDIDNLMVNIKEVITSGGFVGGPNLEEFEANFSEYTGAKHTIGVGSGTDALIFALIGLGIGIGDEVIVPANTFIATALAVTHVGATPVFCDVDPETYLMTSETAEKVLTDKTKAVIPVHLYGNVCDMHDIVGWAMGFGLRVVEDCAQAVGASYLGQHVGTFGDAGCFSFYPAKNLGGLGQGGAIITDNKAVVAKAVCLGNVGRKEGSWYEYSDVGYNSRLDAINAVFLNTCLEHIDEWTDNRRQAARWYNQALVDVGGVHTPIQVPEGDHVFHLYEVRFKDTVTRDYIQDKLKEKGVFAALHYPVPCHEQEVYADLVPTIDLEVTESLARTLLSLPMHPFITEAEVAYVCATIKDALEELKKNGTE